VCCALGQLLPPGFFKSLLVITPLRLCLHDPPPACSPGNDARFTMEAFLALTGHTICSDPAAAHNNALLHDPRYKQQLEASIQAAAEQGWGAPVPVQAPPKRGKAPSSGGGSAGTSPCPGFGSRPTSATGRPTSATGRPTSATDSGTAGGAWEGRPAPAAAGSSTGAWGRPAAAAAATAAASNGSTGAWGRPAPAAVKAASNGSGAWNKPAQPAQPAPAQAAPQQQRRPNNNPYLPNNPYQPTEDSW